MTALCFHTLICRPIGRPNYREKILSALTLEQPLDEAVNVDLAVGHCSANGSSRCD